MVVTDLFAGEFATELIKQLLTIVRKSTNCRESAEQLIEHLNELSPIIEEIKYSGVELPQFRQSQLSRLSETLREADELSRKVLQSRRWNVYKNLQLARKMEKLEKKVASFLKGPMQAHVLADVHHLRFDTDKRFDQLDGSVKRIEQRLTGLKIGVGGWCEGKFGVALEEELKREERCEGEFGVALEVGLKKVKEMVIGRDDVQVVGISGIGGSGKTTLARELCKDVDVQSFFYNNVLLMSVSRSPDVEALKLRISEFVSKTQHVQANTIYPHWNFKCESRALVVLDDVWTLLVLKELIVKAPGCKTLVVSRFKFPAVELTYEMKLMNEDEAMALFCCSAFGQKSIPLSANHTLVKQVVDKCKGLPLALKVIGASLRDQPQIFWLSAKNRLSRGESISESHEIYLLERMKTSISYLPGKVRECFLDLASFPEGKKIPLDVLINMWVEIHDLDEVEGFAILIELSEKNLLNLVKDKRTGDLYSCYYEIYVTQHDVLRDLALYLCNSGCINQQRRLLMPRRGESLPKEWMRNMDQNFEAQIVSIHTGEMKEMDWFPMQFPMAEVLILNFSSDRYFLPPFIKDMRKLRALILINHSTSHAFLLNPSVFVTIRNVRSLWFERIYVPQLPKITLPLENMFKVSLVLCKIDPCSNPSVIHLPWIFPHLTELTMDHCIGLTELPKSFCGLRLLKSLSFTNCHDLLDLPSDIGMLEYLEILRIYACPRLKVLPPGICQLGTLKYLDISQCVDLVSLPEGIGRLKRLEKIDMRECLHMRRLPKSVESLQSLRHLVCDEEISWMWKAVKALPQLRIQVAEECFTLDWLED